MAQRRESGIDLLIGLPWYVAATVGAIAWLTAPYIASFLAASSPLLARAHEPLIGILHLLSYALMAVTAASFLRRLLLVRQFGTQRSLADLRALTWQQFELIVGEVFRRQGYSVTETGQGGADGGVDLVLSKGGRRYLVQCKLYRASTVGVTTVREIYGVVAARGAAGAIVVTTGSFTKDAIAFARTQTIELIDGGRLEVLVRGLNGLPVTVSQPPARPTPLIAACPRCAQPMVLRTPRGGGQQFWGCSVFPKCRGVRPLS